MRNLQKIFEECLDKVKALDIPVGTIDSIGWKKLDKKWAYVFVIKKQIHMILKFPRYVNEKLYYWMI